MAKFQPGQSGNPEGRPRGTRNRSTVLAERLFDGDAEAIIKKAIEQAKAGESTALRLCLERIVPPRKDRPVAFELPEIESAADAAKAARAVARAVAEGDLTPEEGNGIAKMLESVSKTIETSELEARIAALESRKI